MSTRNFVPRSGSEGQLGTQEKPWGVVVADIGHFATLSGSISGSQYSTGSFGRLHVAGNSNINGDVTIGGNINIGDADTDSLTIAADLTSNLVPNADSTFDIGTSAKNWKVGHIEQISSTHVTASGNISGSVTSTGSFGTLQSSTATIPSLLGDVTAGGKIVIDQNQPIEFHLTQGNRDRIIRDSTSNAMNMLSRANIGLIIDSNSDDTDAVFSVRMNGYTHAASTPLLTVTQQHEISGSAASTGSFGRLETAGDIQSDGRIFEQDTSVIDHATAMAIVFGG